MLPWKENTVWVHNPVKLIQEIHDDFGLNLADDAAEATDIGEQNRYVLNFPDFVGLIQCADLFGQFLYDLGGVHLLEHCLDAGLMEFFPQKQVVVNRNRRAVGKDGDGLQVRFRKE